MTRTESMYTTFTPTATLRYAEEEVAGGCNDGTTTTIC